MHPWIGRSRKIRVPIVLMMRQPPVAVPAPIARAHATMTHAGTGNLAVGSCWPWYDRSAIVITPMLFCASFVPCERAMNPDEKSWSLRAAMFTRAGRERRNAQ